MKRYIGIDLHTNSFTCCFLQANGKEPVQTWSLQNEGLEQFIKGLAEGDEIAIEATGNAAHFCKMVEPHVRRVVVIAPWQFEVTRHSVKKTNKHDSRAIALFLSKDMLPEARIKSDDHVQLTSLITTSDQLVKLCVSLLGKLYGMFVRHDLKIKRKILKTKVGFAREVAKHDWASLEQAELIVIESQLHSLHAGIKKLEKDLAAYFGIFPKASNSNETNNSGRIAKRYSPYFHSFYENVKARRGTGKVIIATARKLLNTIFYTLKNGWVFENFTIFSKINTCN